MYVGLKTADLHENTEANGRLSKSFKSILITNSCAPSLNFLIYVRFTALNVLCFLILLSAANSSISLLGSKLSLLS